MNTKTLTLTPIGVLHQGEDGAFAEIFPPHRPALAGLAGFSHVQLIWWFDRPPETAPAPGWTERKPYRRGPEVLGAFATRTPLRPNPLALSCAGLLAVDEEAGVLRLDYVDAADGTPLFDLKPYTPSVDRVGSPQVPAWCAHWPGDVEHSGDFAWEEEFNF